MWLYTTEGFYSIVQDRNNASRLMVRARDLNDLRNFRHRLRDANPDNRVDIVETVNADYLYRLFAPRQDVMRVVGDLTCSIDYDNYKNAVSIVQGHERASIYMRVWSAMVDLQKPWRDRLFGWESHQN